LLQLPRLSGWPPDPGQPQPIRRGSGRIALAEALRVLAAAQQGKLERP
jgi:hypothetical protein